MRSAFGVLFVVLLGCDAPKAPAKKSDEPAGPRSISSFGEEPLLLYGKPVNCSEEPGIGRACDVAPAAGGKARFADCVRVGGAELTAFPGAFVYPRAHFLRCPDSFKEGALGFAFYVDDERVPAANGELFGLVRVVGQASDDLYALNMKFQSIYGRSRLVNGFFDDPSPVRACETAGRCEDAEAWLARTVESGPEAGQRRPPAMTLLNMGAARAIQAAAEAEAKAQQKQALDAVK